MELAQADPVGDPRFSGQIGIRDDVCGVEQLGVPKTADGTVLSIGPQDAFAKGLLVKALACRPFAVTTRQIGLGHVVTSCQ
jgi:hypothetical protein